ncbi:energy transducer TonB [Frigoriflavimonas asaccharolytica]|uniref:TonB C-terminal domain-containing protein n=1 Tax=Frigoriflavimonas asaccharolytica TaxID=2735899 RepID=A0A8J8G869_9FLAO|nr:hypothetical protein [Frigoriflavimonas asaccharolytica]NRS91045.1 hypothetical protein [Frigoriflavimonas asaccharolytica]
MKKLLIVLFAIHSSFALSQEKKKTTDFPPKQAAVEPKAIEINESNSAEKLPIFPGGVMKFRDKLAEKIDPNKIIGSGKLRAVLVFDVDTEGEIADIKVNGQNTSFNAEIQKAVLRINGKWIPAEMKGKKVKYKYTIPVIMMFES